MIAKAIQIAAQVHQDQTDKGGEPYILHALAVMQKAGASVGHLAWKSNALVEEVMIVGVLHDVIEDFDGNPGDRALFRDHLLRTFGEVLFESLDALTHRRGESYQDYIERVAANPMARIVKIADLTHNMDTGRLPEGEIGEKDFERWDKYRRSLVRLKRKD